MIPRRVVITGMGAVSPIGNDLDSVTRALRDGRSGVRYMPAWAELEGLETHVAAPVADGLDERAIPRKHRRGMGPQAVFAGLAARQAVAQAGLDAARLSSGRLGVSVGSTVGSPERQWAHYAHMIEQRRLSGLGGTSFFAVMGHTCAANLAVMFGVTGRVVAPMSACTSGSQGIGVAFEAIRFGLQDAMICGGADEAHFTAAATFDNVGGTSRGYHDRPTETPRPFDRDRDGFVLGEGAGVLVLEALDVALARGAAPLAEVLAFHTTCDGTHLSQPQAAGMIAAMEGALDQAGLGPEAVDYVNAHATATDVGDPVEAAALRAVLGAGVPVSSTKGHTGHTLGACGGLEAIFCVQMMRADFLAPTLNLASVDPDCGGLAHLQSVRAGGPRVAMSNNFAFGGVNTSLILQSI